MVKEGTFVLFEDKLYHYVYPCNIQDGRKLVRKIAIRPLDSDSRYFDLLTVEESDIVILSREEYPEYYI